MRPSYRRGYVCRYSCMVLQGHPNSIPSFSDYPHPTYNVIIALHIVNHEYMYSFPSFHKSSIIPKSAAESLAEILTQHYARDRELSPSRSISISSTNTNTKVIQMPSSKGEPTDPQLREEAHQKVLDMEKGTFFTPTSSPPSPLFSRSQIPINPFVVVANIHSKQNTNHPSPSRRWKGQLVSLEGRGDVTTVRGDGR